VKARNRSGDWIPRMIGAVLLGFPIAGTGAAQAPQPGLVVPVPSAQQVRVTTDSFTAPGGVRRAVEVYRGVNASGRTPVVVFANGNGPALMRARSYVEWARLTTTRGLTAVLYEGPSYDMARPFAENINGSVAHLDSVLALLQRRGPALRIDPTNVVIWAGSAQTMTGTPFALSGTRPVKGYVLYYGSGAVASPRTDVPVFIARAGLDATSLNAGLDSLTRQLIDAGSPVTVMNYPAGSHAFDIIDNTAMSARIINETLDFMAAVTDSALHASIVDGVPESQASAAMAAQRWADAARHYSEIARRKPNSRVVVWRLGLAQLGNGENAAALASFDRAKTLGQGGARDIGLPATRAAVRAGNTAKAVEWVKWALQSFPRIRDEIAADPELAPLLEHPQVKGG
jgi:acetyl esterase/lipase